MLIEEIGFFSSHLSQPMEYLLCHWVHVITVIYNSVIPDLFQFDYGELQKNKEAILGNFSDTIDNDKTVPDPGVVNAFIETHQEFKDM